MILIYFINGLNSCLCALSVVISLATCLWDPIELTWVRIKRSYNFFFSFFFFFFSFFFFFLCLSTVAQPPRKRSYPFSTTIKNNLSTKALSWLIIRLKKLSKSTANNEWQPSFSLRHNPHAILQLCIGIRIDKDMKNLEEERDLRSLMLKVWQ